MILVTGGTGLLGSHLLFDLAQQGKKLRVLYRNESGKAALLKTFLFYQPEATKLLEKLEFVQGDVLDYFSLLDALVGVNEVYHCAAMVSFAPKDAALMTKINVEGTANLVNACIECGVKKLCHVSSVAALGKAEQGNAVDENTFWKSSPENSIYSISKYKSEQEVWRGVQEGLNAIVVNPTVILGPGDWEKGSSNLFRSAKKGMKYYTEGVTGFIDVRDVSKCMIQLMESNLVNERYLLNAENFSYRNFFDVANTCFQKAKPHIHASLWLSNVVWRIEKLRSFFTGSNPLITRETTRAAHQKNYFSNQKIKEAIGINFIPIAKSISDTCTVLSY
jgi:dihydroflavonol-4-reductase